ncbi:hypothetical protein ACHAWF_012106 [Thalassiosira exigua]
MRAHEAHAERVAVSKGARVFTVFSMSKNHNQGSQAMTGYILIDFEKMHVVNQSPTYRNQYVHRRDSISLAMLSEVEIKEQVQLGLIEGTGEEANGKVEEDEEWEDFDEDDLNTSREETENDGSVDDSDVDEGYVFGDRPKSSADPGRTTASPPPGATTTTTAADSTRRRANRRLNGSTSWGRRKTGTGTMRPLERGRSGGTEEGGSRRSRKRTGRAMTTRRSR